MLEYVLIPCAVSMLASAMYMLDLLSYVCVSYIYFVLYVLLHAHVVYLMFYVYNMFCFIVIIYFGEKLNIAYVCMFT